MRLIRPKRVVLWSSLLTALFVFITGAAAYWTADSVPGGNGAANSGTVGSASNVVVPQYSNSGSFAVSWTAATLSSGGAVNGYDVTRYAGATGTPAGGTCAGTVGSVTCNENGAAEGAYTYKVTSRFSTNWLGPESSASETVTVDNTAPTGSITSPPHRQAERFRLRATPPIPPREEFRPGLPLLSSR